MLDYEKRDQIIFGKNRLDEYANHGGVLNFGDDEYPALDINTVKKLIEEGFLDDSSRDYDPTLRDFVEFCEHYPQVKMNGFAVSPERSDCAVVLTGLECDENITMELLLDFANNFHYADDFSVSMNWLYCWWD